MVDGDERGKDEDEERKDRDGKGSKREKNRMIKEGCSQGKYPFSFFSLVTMSRPSV